jgi:hypothetical protein
VGSYICKELLLKKILEYRSQIGNKPPFISFSVAMLGMYEVSLLPV